MNCLSAEVQTEIFSPSEFKAQNANKTAKTRVKRSKYKLVNPNSSFALSFITYKHDFSTVMEILDPFIQKILFPILPFTSKLVSLVSLVSVVDCASPVKGAVALGKNP